MCFSSTIDFCEKKYAKKDIPVIKLLGENLSSPYYPDFKYTIGRNMPSIELHPLFNKTYLIIREGYHSFSCDNEYQLHASFITNRVHLKFLNSTYLQYLFPPDCSVYNAVIPEGSLYYKNHEGFIVSESIRIEGKDDKMNLSYSDELINIVLNNGKNKPYKDCTMEERHQIEYVQFDFIGKKWYFNCNSQPLICKAEDISYGWRKLYCDTFFEKEIIRTLVNPLYRKWIKESLGYNIPELIWVEINNDICAVQYNNPRLREFRITPHAEVKDAWLPYIIYVD